MPLLLLSPLVLAWAVEIPVESNGRVRGDLGQVPCEVQGLAAAGRFRSDAGGRMAVSGSSFSYEPPADYSGLDSFSWRVGEEMVTVTLRIGHPPVADADAFSTSSGTSLEVGAEAGLLVNDLRHHGALVEVGGRPDLQATTLAGGTVQATAQGAFLYVPPPGFSGSDGFSYRIANGLGQDLGEVKLEVRPDTTWGVEARSFAEAEFAQQPAPSVASLSPEEAYPSTAVRFVPPGATDPSGARDR